jgi:hypothetical protein
MCDLQHSPFESQRNRHMTCPACAGNSIQHFHSVQSYTYFACKTCDLLFLDPVILQTLDNGHALRPYDQSYWRQELSSARDRAYGPCLARLAETLYYLTIPLNVFLDIGTGPGYFLDAVDAYFPRLTHKTFGVEKFPPLPSERTCSDNYFMCDIDAFPLKVDAGLCVEVIEHLTPSMLTTLLTQLAAVSNNGALYIFNSGQPDFVRNEDMSYLDPLIRGHIVSWSVMSVRILAEPLGFSVHRIPGKTWAMALEFAPNTAPLREVNISSRIWNPIKDNIDLLIDANGGSVFKILGLESARAYH